MGCHTLSSKVTCVPPAISTQLGPGELRVKALLCTDKGTYSGSTDILHPESLQKVAKRP